MSAETWWNSSIASTVPLNASGASFSNANRSVACVQISDRVGAVQEVDERADLALRGAGVAEVVLGLDLPVGEEPELGQSSVEENDAPIDRSGTATMTFLRPWL